MLMLYVPVVVLVVGVLIFAFSLSVKWGEVGRILFWVGCLTFLLGVVTA
jgi:hypothetical protein